MSPSAVRGWLNSRTNENISWSRIAEEAVVVFTHIADGDVEQVGVVPGYDLPRLFQKKRGDVCVGMKYSCKMSVRFAFFSW